MLIISKEQVGELIRKVEDASDLDACMQEVRHMLDIKTGLAWRADGGIGGS